MARLTPEQIVDKQIRRAQQETQSYIDGVNAVTESPMAKAAANVEGYLNGVQEAVASGRWQQALLDTSISDWKTQTAGKGGGRWSEGVAKARPKLIKFQREYTPIREAIAAQVDSMPNSTFEERMARMNANARGLHDRPYKGRRGR